MEKEKIIQISVDSANNTKSLLYALTNKGRIFRLRTDGEWEEAELPENLEKDK